MTALAAERTGHFEAVWRPRYAETAAAPARTTIAADLLDTLPRAHDRDDVVVLPGFVRYRIGQPHPQDPWSVYLHRVDATP